MNEQVTGEEAQPPAGLLSDAAVAPPPESAFADHQSTLGAGQPTAAAQPVISGQYEGEMSAPASGLDLLDMRVDVDTRYANSPVMGRVSGDFYQLNKINLPGSPPRVSRVYRESWVVNQPLVQKSPGKVEITGQVSFWKGIHPSTTLKIALTLGSSGVAGAAQVTFTRQGGQPVVYNCVKKSDCFRKLNLEIDVCKSVNTAPLLPNYSTSAHAVKPSGLASRTLSIEEAYREAGVCVNIRPDHTVIDDSNPSFNSWSDAELHDALETYFSQIAGPWPQWELWGMMAGSYDEPGVGGIMFDAAAVFGGAGKAPERQGFAIFRNHSWFDRLPAGAPANQAEAEAARQFLYTWVHEAGHAFNFLHSWDKNRPNALSWMNYDWRYDNLNGADSFWSNFRFRFDDEELIHLRHGDRSSVIMGGDPWASGGHMEAPPGAEYLQAPPGAMSSVEGASPVELLIRSKEYFEFMEPVSVELRIRNLFADLPLNLDTRLSPEYGGVVIYIRRPDGRIVEYSPVMCKLAFPSVRNLTPLQAGGEQGDDRYSEEVLISYGRYGFYFDVPGEYLIRALYQGAGDLLIPSNVHRLRVGNPLTKDLDVTAQDYFSYEVGMSLYLDGSRSPYLSKAMNLLQDMSERYSNSMLGARLATTVANSLTRPFFRIQDEQSALSTTQELKMVKTSDAEPQQALDVTDDAVEVFRKTKQKSMNLAYHQLVSQRVECLTTLDQQPQARRELEQLHKHLSDNGANPPVLRQISNLAERIGDTPGTDRYRLWDRIRAREETLQPEAAEGMLTATASSKPTPRAASKATKKSAAKKRGSSKGSKKG